MSETAQMVPFQTHFTTLYGFVITPPRAFCHSVAELSCAAERVHASGNYKVFGDNPFLIVGNVIRRCTILSHTATHTHTSPARAMYNILHLGLCEFCVSWTTQNILWIRNCGLHCVQFGGVYSRYLWFRLWFFGCCWC